MITWAYAPTVLAVVVSLAGCGLPSADRQRAEYAASQVEEQRKALPAAQSDFDKVAQDSFFGPFVRRENLGDSFKQAGAALDEAKKRYQARVVPILEADKSRRRREAQGRAEADQGGDPQGKPAHQEAGGKSRPACQGTRRVPAPSQG